MTMLEERKRRGEEIVKKYRTRSGNDTYACAADVISDVLLAVAQNEDEGVQILQSAEMDFRGAFQGERFFTEG